ncbi:camp-regulated phosphoprotein/endosulfine conserved region-domain-containing protein [Phakopsora pachyrhizi]|uniref:mRNA stability protein n=1 Tax=Phakopsora pachyrhizi TaxID=170000 RepID=A0AAV0BQL7_PHAPC|nr:camp-regulated phosphoprotein/endosulfine conserved region-domain-containing protein [Phakopsora pachyrhizi]CAH7687898.1 camp-regulated phospho protein/endosulfine conserved region-domain-containing protein [Phakopsora pachyrhizi]
MALNPHQRQKVDISQMTEEEQKLFRLYGKLPPKKNVAKHNLMERKYFDSGDYALSKAGKTAPQSVGTAIPFPENIHHASHPGNLTSVNSSSSNPNNQSTNDGNNSALPSTLPSNGDDNGLLNSVDNSITSEVEKGSTLEPTQPLDYCNVPTEGYHPPAPSAE